MITDRDGNTYKLENGRWQGDNARVVELLNQRYDLLASEIPPVALPDPIGLILRDAATLLGGRVIETPVVNFVAGRVY